MIWINLNELSKVVYSSQEWAKFLFFMNRLVAQNNYATTGSSSLCLFLCSNSRIRTDMHALRFVRQKELKWTIHSDYQLTILIIKLNCVDFSLKLHKLGRLFWACFKFLMTIRSNQITGRAKFKTTHQLPAGSMLFSISGWFLCKSNFTNAKI